MLKHYLLLALRNLAKQKIQSLVKILGLALGLSASIVIMLVNHSELTRDAFWQDADLIYVAEFYGSRDIPDSRDYMLEPRIKHDLKDFYPQLAATARTFANTTVMTTVNSQGERQTFSETATQADVEFFDIFKFELLHGSLAEFSRKKNVVVLSEKNAIRYFGQSDPIGKIMTIDTRSFTSHYDMPTAADPQASYTVIAVIRDIPYHTDIHYGVVFPYTDLPEPAVIGPDNPQMTIRFSARTYLKLQSINQLSDIETSQAAFVDKHYLTQWRSNYPDPSKYTRLGLINIAQARMETQGQQSTSERVWMLYLLAFIILTMASINTINLTLAAYAQRQQEVTLRKTLGAKRREILLQFWLDALVSLAFALMLAFIMLELIMPVLTQTLGLSETRHFLYMSDFLAQIFALMLLLSVVIGCYPGLYLANIKPALILHSSRAYETLGSIRLRKLLMVVQFTLSSALVIAAGLVSMQLHMTKNYDPGYQTENILFIYHPTFAQLDKGQFNQIKQRIQKLPGVEAVSSVIPGTPGEGGSKTKTARADQSLNQAFPLQWALLPDADLLQLLNIPLLAGRTITITDDPSAPGSQPQVAGAPQKIDEIIINQQALIALGFDSPEAAIGQTIKRYFNDMEEATTESKIVGVTSWLHLGDHNKSAEPAVLWMPWMKTMQISLGLRFKDTERQLLDSQVNEIWSEIFGVKPHTWLLEDSLADQYKSQTTTARFIFLFSVLSIVISIMGLYGLAALSAQKRTREIALRKLHGASAFAIITLLCVEFSRLVLIASVISLPIALYSMGYWLESFKTKIDLMTSGGLMGCLTLVLLLAVTWLVSGAQAWKVARTKPALMLREE